MKRIAIARLQRLIRLTGQVYDQLAHEAAKTGSMRDELSSSLAETRSHLDGSSFAATAFPGLIANRATRLGQELDILTEDLKQRVNAAAASKAGVKGLEGKLHREIAGALQESELKGMEDVVDRLIRQRKASLP